MGGPGFKWWEMMNRPRMVETIAEDIDRRSRHTSASTAVVQTGRSVSFGNRSMGSVRVMGATATYPEVHAVDLADGFFFSEMDDRSARRVAVLGAGIAENLFPVEDPLGKEVRIGGSQFRVIGVTTKEGQGAEGAASEDYVIQVPFEAFKTLWGTRWRDVSIRVKIAEGEDILDAKDEVIGIVRVSRRLEADEENNFEINEQESLRAQVEPIKSTIYAIGIGLTGLALLVGGIGVMNIMFVSVKERTKEIGIRKAVGAKRRTILIQFLIEAVTVSVIGGIIGVALSIPIFLLVRTLMPAQLGLDVISMAFLICLAIGVIFGLAPAWTAARAEPIDALRYE
jgi:putative ABC transport system permease protein